METNKFLDVEGLSQLWHLIVNHSNSKLFIGTREEYEGKNKNGEIPFGCVVVLIDELNDNNDEGGEDLI